MYKRQAKACVETTLENGNDAIFGALFWFVLFGGAGAVIFRLSNTLDAMWGYKTERFLHFGWAAAVSYTHLDVYKRQSQGCAGAFAETQTEVKKRLGFEGMQLCLVSRFSGAVAKNAVASNPGINMRSGEQSGGHNEAVDQQQHAALRCPQHGTRHHDDLEAAELGEHRHCVCVGR